MTYKDALQWMIDYSINGEFINIIDIRDVEDQSEWWKDMFGGCPSVPVQEGKYMYFYSNQVYDDVEDENGKVIEPDAQIELEYPNNTTEFIKLYRLDD